jgi:hypothetical protein
MTGDKLFSLMMQCPNRQQRGKGKDIAGLLVRYYKLTKLRIFIDAYL